jgi:DNA repair exonuclease SbcCD ATPase subunit
MAEIKATSFRIVDEDGEKFKQFMEKEGIKTQAEGFKAIMQAVEVAQAKNAIQGRAKEIESFQDTINRLMGYYLNSLEINQNSEERIREELSKELQTKDNTISTMYEQLEELKSTVKYKSEQYDILEGKLQETQETLMSKSQDCIRLEKQVDKINSNNDLLQEQLQEYKGYKDNYKKLEKDLEQLKSDIDKKDVIIQGFTTDNQQLKDKINNDSEMINFYKSNNAELKDNIKALEDKYDKQIDNIKADHEKALQEQIKANTDQLNNKHEVEIAKKDLELQKLQNEIEQLKAKAHKPANNKTKQTNV